MEDCVVTQNTKKHYFGFRSTEGQTFYWSIMTADDSVKCRCANSGMTGQVGGFQNPGVCLQAFPSFPPHPLPTLLLAPFFARSLTLVPPFLLLNRTETLTTQAKNLQTLRAQSCQKKSTLIHSWASRILYFALRRSNYLATNIHSSKPKFSLRLLMCTNVCVYDRPRFSQQFSLEA